MAGRRVKLGILLPTRGVLLWNKGIPEVGPVIDLAVRAEELGYDSVFVGDSILAKPRLEALSVLSAVAVKTQRVKLGTAIFLPCLRHPVFLAYQVATLDVISGGRVILGVGIGPPKPQECEHEFETLGVPFRKRMFYMQEHMTLMRKLWTEDNVTFEGRYYRCENVTLTPKPIQGSVPMWIASATVETAWRRVGRFGDGWFPNRVTPEEFQETWGKIKEEAKVHGRDAGTPAWYMTTCLDDDKEKAMKNGEEFLLDYYYTPFWGDSIEKWGTYGPAKDLIDRINAFIAAGAEHISLRFTHKDQMAQLERFTAEVLPELKLD
ncbi:MAG: LLM class flavin-dependent oxidoreductase [bacterium]|nr:LLM class flavin-dependent oxidoreductase [bacterium]